MCRQFRLNNEVKKLTSSLETGPAVGSHEGAFCGTCRPGQGDACTHEMCCVLAPSFLAVRKPVEKTVMSDEL